jgi:hypothetical protein
MHVGHRKVVKPAPHKAAPTKTPIIAQMTCWPVKEPTLPLLLELPPVQVLVAETAPVPKGSSVMATQLELNWSGLCDDVPEHVVEVP